VRRKIRGDEKLIQVETLNMKAKIKPIFLSSRRMPDRQNISLLLN